MSGTVYSAARGFYPIHGKSKEEAWKEVTAMFGLNAGDYKTFIVNGYSLKPVKRRKPDEISIGDVFKYSSYMGNDYFIHIVECSPYKSFAFDERSSSNEGQRDHYETRMEFFLSEKNQTIRVEVRRRNKCPSRSLFQYLSDKIQGRENSAAKLLQSILSSTPGHNGSQWEDGETQRGEIIVKRDDSYRRNF